MDKDQIINLKKFIKEENPGGQRLSSFRPARDLTLGGPMPRLQKKQFVPNLNISRNKDKAKEALKKSGFPKPKDNKFAKRDNTERKKDTSRFVQSSGIFSDGIGSGDIRRTTRSSDRRSDKENDGGPSSMSIPTLRKKSWEVDKKLENNVFDDLMGIDDNNEEEEDEEKLPFQPINWFNVSTGVKKEIKIEPGAAATSSSHEGAIQPGLKNLKLDNEPYVSSEYAEQDDNYSDSQPALSLWKLPDSLCGKGLSDDPNCNELSDFCLNDMLEGQIGKLVLRKSGKMEVHIGKVVYQLDQPNLDCFSEEIVLMDPGSERGPTATVLGELKNRYSINPDWDSLLK